MTDKGADLIATAIWALAVAVWLNGCMTPRGRRHIEVTIHKPAQTETAQERAQGIEDELKFIGETMGQIQ